MISREEYQAIVRRFILGICYDAIISKRAGAPLATWMELTAEQVDVNTGQWYDRLLKDFQASQPKPAVPTNGAALRTEVKK